MKRQVGLLLALGLMACSPGGTVTAGRVDRVPVGQWGGDHVRLTVSDIGGSVEFDCAHGTLDAPLNVDTDGRFSVPGSLVREGGPVVPGREGDKQSARYTGRLDGSSMDMDLVVPDGGDRIGSFHLKLGDRGKLVKCL